MAITYKSEGAGVSTETSGAALAPAQPAVVDQGDIMFAHIFWEGTTEGPSSPPEETWTLLSGPQDVGTTPNARHWVYGRVASSNAKEDGEAQTFDSGLASTNQRAARIYSFSGAVATLAISGYCPAESFSSISNANKIQPPTVTTTVVGALALSFGCQNDNNTQTAFGVGTGGTWAEAVAEYVVALTPGFALQIQTCTPTANPGTVTGGTVSGAANDPSGTIGFEIRPDSPAPPNLVMPTMGVVA